MQTSTVKISNSLLIAHWGVFLTLVCLLVSPPLANITMLLTIIWVFAFAQLRQLIANVFLSKSGKVILLWLCWILLTAVWSITSFKESVDGIFTWRKLLFFWISFAIYQVDDELKAIFLRRLLVVGTVLIVASFVVKFASPMVLSNEFWLSFFQKANMNEPSRLIAKFYEGTVVRDRIIQSIVFSIVGLMSLYWFVHKKQMKYLCLTAFVALNLFMVTTGRSGYVFLLLALSSYIALEPKIFSSNGFKKALCIAGVTGILVGGFLSFENSRERITLAASEFTTGIQQAENTSIGLRLLYWQHTLELVPDYILQGTGPGGFEKAYNENLPVAFARVGDPHNQYLRLLMEQGVLGVIFLIAFLYTLIRYGDKKYTALTCSLILALSASNFFNSHFTSYEGYFLWGLLGILAANGRKLGQS